MVNDINFELSGWGRVRGHPNGAGSEQDRPHLSERNQPVSFWQFLNIIITNANDGLFQDDKRSKSIFWGEDKIVYHIFRLEAEKLAAECRMKLYRTSVKEDLNVGVVFQHLAENYVNQVPIISSTLVIQTCKKNEDNSTGEHFLPQKN